MHELIRIATPEIASFLSEFLPTLSDDWWEKHVFQRLSFHQQRMAEDRRIHTIQHLDFSALLRVFDQNWHELSGVRNLPREGRNWVKELQTVRNKWAHLSAEDLPASEVYRDADTLCRFLSMIRASQASLDAVENGKTAAVAAMAQARAASADLTASLKSSTEAGKTSPNHQHSAGLFCVGDLVSLRSDPATILPVIGVLPGDHERRYQVFQNNSRSTYYESQLQAVADSDEKQIVTPAELRARLTAFKLLAPSTTSLFSLRAGRVQFVPYQYRPVLKLIQSDRPRLLIADEVGVGKTIEAGLILKELMARTDLSSVLIICPKALVAERKWFVEMKRFDENFTALNGELLRHCLKETQIEGHWPEQYGKAILPFSLFDSDLIFGRKGRTSQKTGLLELDPPPRFDLVIVDEAHHIRNTDTFLHQGVRYFCDNAEAVIFLSATPLQLGSEDLFTLLNVLRPDLIIDHASFEEMAAPNPFINAAIKHCRNSRDRWQDGATKSLREAGETEWGRLFLRETPAFQSVFDRLQGESISDTERIQIIRELEELYTFSSLINRTRRRDIGEFTTRKPETITLELTPSQKKLHDALLDVIARILTFSHGHQNVKFMMTTIRRQASSCLYGLAPLLGDMLNGKLDKLELAETGDLEVDLDETFLTKIRSDIEGLITEARDLDPADPKMEALVSLVTKKATLENSKTLLFSSFRHTLAYLVRNLQRTNLRCGLIHGGVPDSERADLRYRFSLPKSEPNAVDVLLSSEVGCEGLDFQFCDFLINYDLPWNPMRIEQRIGRIDRFGQKSETVAIVNLITSGTIDFDIYDRCLSRIGVFQHAIGGSEEILGEITSELQEIADAFKLTPEERANRLRQLSDNSINRIREEQVLESKQADLFGLNVPSQAWRKEIEAAESQSLSPAAIEQCTRSYLSARLGGDGEYLMGGKALRLNNEDRGKLLEDFKHLPRSTEPVARDWEKWLKGSQSTLTVTFDHTIAIENSKDAYLTVTHPLIRQAARFLQPQGDPLFTSLKVESADVPPDRYQFALYRWKKNGIKTDEILVPVSLNPVIEPHLLALIQKAVQPEGPILPTQSELDDLDAFHHAKWTAAQADHIAENRQQTERRIQSLETSHKARSRAIEEQIRRATNDKIRIMKQGEMARANADFARRITELQQSENCGDIHFSSVVFGVITVA